MVEILVMAPRHQDVLDAAVGAVDAQLGVVPPVLHVGVILEALLDIHNGGCRLTPNRPGVSLRGIMKDQ